MRQWKSSLLLVLLAAVCLPQSGTNIMTPEARRVGERLACKCGSCNNTVGNCPMLECHYASPAREKISAMQKAGKTDDAIVDNFVQESGLSALASPPTQGFNLLGWVMPFIALAIGLIAVTIYLKRFHPKRAPQAATPEIDPEMLARYRERIDKEVSKLE